MFGQHWLWIVLLLVVVLIIFGPGRLPELGGAVGKAMREFRKATTELTNEMRSSVETKPEPSVTVTSPEPTPSPTAGTAGTTGTTGTDSKASS